MEFPQLSTRMHTLITSVISYMVFLLSYFIRFYVMNGVVVYDFSVFHLMALFTAVTHYAVYSLFFYPQVSLYRRLGKQIQRTMLCECLCMGILLALLFLIDLQHIPRLMLFINGVLSVLFISLKHLIIVRIFSTLHQSGYYQRSVLLIGEGATAMRYAYTVTTQPEAGHKLLGYVASCGQHIESSYLGGYDALEDALSSLSPQEAIIALPACEYTRLDRIIVLCEKYGVPLRIIPCYEERVSYQIVTSTFENIQMIGIRDIPLNRLYNAFIKRAFDIAISLIMLIVLSPLMLCIAVGVRMSTHESVLFKQVRVGKDKKPFMMLKFRSMRTNDGEDSAWSTTTDNRRTLFGALIRKFSVDELPQLINVLKGDMSIVGPRPEIPLFVEQFRDEIPLYMIRHMVKPGITGLAQVNGYRGDTSIKRRIQFDIEYIENWTIWVDIRIMLRTIPSLVNDEKLPPIHE